MRVAVVGAGIAGLTCAWRLSRLGHRVEVFEREERPGGRMSTVAAAGMSVDIGANLLMGQYAHLRGLLAELGMAEQWFPFHVGAGGILRDRELASFTPQGLFDVLRYRGLSLAGRLELVRYFLQAWGWSDELDFFDLGAGRPDMDRTDAYTWVSQNLSPEVAEFLIDPFVRTFHFHGAQHLSMKYFHAMAACFMKEGGFVTHGLRGFMIALPAALADRLSVHWRTPVKAVAEGPGGGVVLETEPKTERFDAAVLAVPAPVVRRLLLDPTPGQAALLGAVRFSSTVLVAYTVPLRVADDFEGIWIPWRESRIVSSCTNETCKGSVRGDECVLELTCSEEAARGLLGRPDAEAARVLADEWCRLFPTYAGHMCPIHVQRWRAAVPVYAPGTATAIARFWEHGQGERDVWFCGDWLNHPWVEGAIRCGERVAALADAAAYSKRSTSGPSGLNIRSPISIALR